jgi:uncharacterized membrane protein (GlpM family)
MDNIFVLKLVLSFIVGSLWITMGTVLAEKHGTKIGGLIAGLPSTILISLFFIAWTQSTNVAVDATTIVPIIGGINCLFIVAYIFLLRLNFWVALGGAFLVWGLFSFTLVVIGFNSFTISLISYVCLVVISHTIVEKGLKVRSELGRQMRYTPAIMISRAVFSGFIIVVAVVITKIGGPLMGGMFVMFPAMFVGMIFMTYFSQGAAFSAAVMKSSILGAISVVVYGIMARYTYIPLGIIGGTATSIIVSFASSYLIHGYMTRRTT